MIPSLWTTTVGRMYYILDGRIVEDTFWSQQEWRLWRGGEERNSAREEDFKYLFLPSLVTVTLAEWAKDGGFLLLSVSGSGHSPVNQHCSRHTTSIDCLHPTQQRIPKTVGRSSISLALRSTASCGLGWGDCGVARYSRRQYPTENKSRLWVVELILERISKVAITLVEEGKVLMSFQHRYCEETLCVSFHLKNSAGTEKAT